MAVLVEAVAPVEAAPVELEDAVPVVAMQHQPHRPQRTCRQIPMPQTPTVLLPASDAESEDAEQPRRTHPPKHPRRH